MSPQQQGSPPDLSIPEAVDLYCRRKRPQWRGATERTYRRDLGEFVDYAEENEIESLSDLQRWNVSGFTDYMLDRDVAKATVASRQKSVKTWLKFLEPQGYVQLGLHLAIDVIKMKDGEETSDQMLAPKDAQKLLEFYRNSTRWRGRRRHAILEVLWTWGAGTAVSTRWTSMTTTPSVAS
jgi:site-specific recombinase XerD